MIGMTSIATFAVCKTLWPETIFPLTSPSIGLLRQTPIGDIKAIVPLSYCSLTLSVFQSDVRSTLAKILYFAGKQLQAVDLKTPAFLCRRTKERPNQILTFAG